MRLFLDINILLDIFLNREPHVEYSSRVFRLAEINQRQGFVSSTSYLTLHYVLSKQIGNSRSTEILIKIRKILQIAPVDEKVIDLALNSEFSDFEDGVQYYSAVMIDADNIITRNKIDFNVADQIPVLTPKEFLQHLK
ncbi:MAG: PIN domain-containing protein [Candidatus Marinimicrobia bacterium]|nr:PIN domain-containing protein [Candidatus Neomarinimicrobiota bacterium]